MSRPVLCGSLIASLVLVLACTEESPKGPENPPGSEREGWTLVWYDEFDDEDLPHSEKWEYDVGGHGWGNEELQYYTARRRENARVEGGVFVIEARKEPWNENEYTSARLVTKGKGDWTYGRFEIRAKLPSGRGTWPAIWMLPTEWTYGDGSWPDNGEIYIIEHVGYDPGWIHGSVHTHAYNWREGTHKTAQTYVSDAETAFHVYAMEWTPERIGVYTDTTEYFTFHNEGTGWKVWPSDKAFHLVLNIAVGGLWGGTHGVDDGIFPQRMEVDYVRVYEKVE